ncbi:MAG: hypothetical protein M3137_21165 [Actinomycetota bacterium]|nr:hypothetical protein [Actinomycetota bacterium]
MARTPPKSSPGEWARRTPALCSRVLDDDVSHWAEKFPGAIDVVKARA